MFIVEGHVKTWETTAEIIALHVCFVVELVHFFSLKVMIVNHGKTRALEDMETLVLYDNVTDCSFTFENTQHQV